MNFLAHFHLAEPTDASRVGNLLGDFVKGTPDSLTDDFPAEVIRGIRMHRAMDRFTDGHAAFHEAKKLLAPKRRRFAGVVIDIFFDHFLALQWGKYSPQPLIEFISETYTILENHQDWLTPPLREILPRMKNEDWLGSYSTPDGIALTLRRVSQRRPRLDPIADCHLDFREHYDAFGKAFDHFYPEALAYAKIWDQNP